jgi:hypothetical protein
VDFCRGEEYGAGRNDAPTVAPRSFRMVLENDCVRVLELLDRPALVGIVMIVAGVIVLQLFSTSVVR